MDRLFDTSFLSQVKLHNVIEFALRKLKKLNGEVLRMDPELENKNPDLENKKSVIGK